MLPRLCVAEMGCTRLKQCCSTIPLGCQISRVFHFSTKTSPKLCATLLDRMKLNVQSSGTTQFFSRNCSRFSSENNLCTTRNLDMSKKLPTVSETTDNRKHNLFSNKFSHGMNILFPLASSKKHFTDQNILECSPPIRCESLQRYSTSPDVRLMKYQSRNIGKNSNLFLSSNVFCIKSSIPTNGIHLAAALQAVDQPKAVHLNPDFESRPSLPQRFVEGCPSFTRPYLQLLRIDRPIGTWLLFWPCGWGLALAAGPGSMPDPWLLAVFATGALVMRGAGCTINDLWDRKIDAKVSRTQMRPLASGAVRPIDAWVFLGAQLSLGLLVLLQLNASAVLLGASSLGLVCVYPLVKRVSHWPQLVLGLTFNWGVLLGWCAVHGSVTPLPVLPLYAAGVCWTLVYDTIYAHQDKADDLAAGVKSTALRFGEDTAVWLTGFSVAMVAGLVVAGQSVGLAWPYYGAVAATAANLVHQIRSLDIHNRAHCGRQFRHNRHIGLLVFLGIVGGSVLATPEEDAGSCSCSSDGRCGKCRSGGSAASGTDTVHGASKSPLRVAILEA